MTDTLSLLFEAATDHEADVIRSVAVRAGLLSRCLECGAIYGPEDTECEFDGLALGAVRRTP